MTENERRYARAKYNLARLPRETQIQLGHTLASYDRCTVKYYEGSYHIEVDSCITTDYGREENCGEYTAEDLFKGNTQWYNHAWDAYTHRLQRAGESLNERRVNTFEKWADEQIQDFIKNFLA